MPKSPRTRGRHAGAASRSLQSIEPRLHGLDGESGALLDALAAAVTALDGVNRLYALLAGAGGPMLGMVAPPLGDELPVAPLDAIARLVPGMAPLAEPLRDAAASLVALVADAPAGTRSLQDACDALHAATHDVVAALPIALPRVPRTRRKAQHHDALGRVGMLLREVGLERADADVHLASDGRGRTLLVAAPVPEETAHVWLLESLYQRVELTVEDHPLLAIERAASRWQFRRWGGDAPLRASADTFGRAVREQEYSLVERTTLAFDAPVIAAFAEQPFFAEVPQRQQRLAGALARSRTGVFTVAAHDDASVELIDAATGRQYHVHEHNEEIGYQPGFVALGRLFSLDGERWLRSPGMAFVSAPERGPAAEFARSLEPMRETMGDALTVEALVATWVGGVGAKLPLPAKPAATRAEARALLQALDAALREAGLAKRVAKRRAPAALRALGPGTRVYEYTLDRDVGEWMQALSEQAGVGPLGPGTH